MASMKPKLPVAKDKKGKNKSKSKAAPKSNPFAKGMKSKGPTNPGPASFPPMLGM